MDEQYARAMGQAPWNMRWSTAGAIGMGTAGYEAWSARGGLTLGHVETGIKDKPSPPGFWHDPHIGPDGLGPDEFGAGKQDLIRIRWHQHQWPRNN